MTARDILVGKIPDPKSQIDQITNALIYKFLDHMDSKYDKRIFFTKKYEKHSWENILKTENRSKLSELYSKGLELMSENEEIPKIFRNIFKNAFLTFNDVETTRYFLMTIDQINCDDTEKIGDGFEYLLSIMGSQGDAGQFRTPRHIIDFIVDVLDPKKDEKILDPACGTAGFLISSYKHIVEKNTKKGVNNLTTTENRNLIENFEGYDISPEMVKLSLVNMYLHKFRNPKIEEYDTLTSENRWNDKFDVILANPPFMSPKGGIIPHKKFLIDAKKSEVLFTDYIAEHLKINGRAGIIVPEGIIFQSNNSYKSLRKNLMETWGLYAVVSLPSGVFQPYSGVKTSILFLDKKFAKKNNEILFIKVENDGFGLGSQRREIDKNDLPMALGILESWKKGKKKKNDLALWVKKEKIAEGGEYNFSSDRYREDVDYSNAKWPMVKLGDVGS